MTKEKQNAIVGRLASEYGEANIYRHHLEAALKEVGQKIESLPMFLRRADAKNVLQTLDSIDFHEVKENAERLVDAAANCERLKEELRKCGVNF